MSLSHCVGINSFSWIDFYMFKLSLVNFFKIMLNYCDYEIFDHSVCLVSQCVWYHDDSLWFYRSYIHRESPWFWHTHRNTKHILLCEINFGFKIDFYHVEPNMQWNFRKSYTSYIIVLGFCKTEWFQTFTYIINLELLIYYRWIEWIIEQDNESRYLYHQWVEYEQTHSCHMGFNW
jgi:hypothetical protein